MGLPTELVADDKVKTRLLRESVKKRIIAPELKTALYFEFPELDECDKVDLRFLWLGADGKLRYRINGWKIVGMDYPQIVFTRFVRAWKENGLKYEIVD